MGRTGLTQGKPEIMLEHGHQESGVEGPAQNAGQNRRRFLRVFDKIEAGDDHGLDLKKLSGREGFRFRIGQYRAISTHEAEVIVIDAGPRGDIYRSERTMTVPHTIRDDKVILRKKDFEAMLERMEELEDIVAFVVQRNRRRKAFPLQSPRS